MKLKNVVVLFLLIVLNLFVNVVHADTISADVIVDCDSDKIMIGKDITCIIKTNLSDGTTLNGFGGEIELSSNLKLISVTIDNNIWQGNGDDGNIQLYTDKQYNNSVEIAKIKIGVINNVNGYLKIKDINLSVGTNFDLVKKSDVVKNFIYSSSTSDNNNGNNNGGNNSDNGNGVPTNPDDSKNDLVDSNGNVNNNPQTGMNLFYIGIILLGTITFVISFLLYNNKIFKNE